jgi:hypothetical protein
LGAQPGALRLTFTYRGSEIRLTSAARVDMVTLPSDGLRTIEARSGFWYEMLDEHGTPIYRRVIENPVRMSAEVRSDDPDRPLTREAIANPEGLFVLQVPDLKAARILAFYSSPLDPSKALEPARMIAQFDLRQPPTAAA